MISAPATDPPIFSLFSIAFSGRGVLAMRDLLTEAIIGATPEWVANQLSAPVAFAQGSTVTLNVVFQASNVDQFPGSTPYTIQASGDLFSVEPRAVVLDIQPLNGFSPPVAFELSSAVPAGIGIHSFTLDWTATDASGNQFAIGSSSHTLYVTWQPVDLGTDLLPPTIPYAAVVHMAVASCAGQTTLDGICGALIAALEKTGIAHTITSGDVRIALLERTADSAGFAALLSQMLLAHGVLAETRAFTIDWSHLPTAALQWVSTVAPAGTPLLSGAQLHDVSLIDTSSGVLLCDADVGIGPVPFPVAMPNDTAWTLTGQPFTALLTTYLEPAAKKVGGRLTGVLPDAPLTLSAIHFNFGGSDAVTLRDPVTDAAIGETAEWVAGMERLILSDGYAGPPPPPAAYVRGTPVVLSVRFRRTLDPQHGGAQTLSITIGATGTPVGIREQAVTLTFDPSGRSQPIRFQTDGLVSADVGAIDLALEWYARSANGQHSAIGTSNHPLYFIWQAITPNQAEDLPDWAYAPLVKWTSAFAAGATSDKDVCDRVMAQLPSTGLKYGVAGWTPRQMLLGNGGMCGGWYQLFQWMLHSQGILIAKRAFQVNWRSLPDSSVEWNAIVVSNGGLNQPVPPVTPSTFNDVDVFPIPSPATIATSRARRYRFWGMPGGGWADGHCVNFAEFDGQLYLYDASFHLGPIALDMPMPPDNGTVLGGAALADFVAKYLSIAVSHMLGSFTVNGRSFVSQVPADAAAGVNGITVETSALPVMVGSTPSITFRWI